LKSSLEKELNERRNMLEQAAGYFSNYLRSAPDGNLRISTSKKYKRYYQVTDKGDSSGKYLRSDADELIRNLAQKDYCCKALKKAEREIRALDGYVKAAAFKFEDVYESMSDERKKLITPFGLSDEEYIRRWLSREYEKMGFEEGAPFYEAIDGKKVRSKSEALIYNTLEVSNVPILYEVPLYLEGYGTVRPDFLVLNVRTRETFVWEHFGMLDNPRYLKQAMKKLEAYINNGYIPGKNLIITFESSEHGLNLATVKQLINTLLK